MNSKRIDTVKKTMKIKLPFDMISPPFLIELMTVSHSVFRIVKLL